MYFLLKDKNKINKILKGLDEKYNMDYAWSSIHSEDWMTNWKKYFKPVIIDDTVLIIPDWDNQEYDYPYIIKIYPAMAFGTGHHQSTQLMIKHMLKYNIGQYENLIDLGCGSGILSIFAKHMGGQNIMALDYDSICEENFKKNCELNNIDDIKFSVANVKNYQDYNCDIVLANIDKKNILTILNKYQKSKSSAILIVAGLLASDAKDILDVLKGYYVESQMQMDEWISMVIKRESF